MLHEPKQCHQRRARRNFESRFCPDQVLANTLRVNIRSRRATAVPEFQNLPVLASSWTRPHPLFEIIRGHGHDGITVLFLTVALRMVVSKPHNAEFPQPVSCAQI